MGIVSVCLILVGLINLAPVIGIFSVNKLNQGYELTLVSQDLILLMQHRALLFGIIGAFILWSAFAPKYQAAAMLMGFASMAGFIILVLLGENHNASIHKIMWVDVVGLVLVVIAALATWRAPA
jgi:membrane-associated HD superfamily phosphohydrolase